MRNKILGIIACLLMTSQAFAASGVTVIPLRANRVKIEDYAMRNGYRVTSDTVRVKGNIGFATLVVKEDKSGGAGDVDIYAEYATSDVSTSDSVWTKAYTTSSGTITVDSNIVTQLGNTTDENGLSENRWIVFTPRMTPFIRFVFDPDADSEVTATLIYQEED